jgi:ribokinase
MLDAGKSTGKVNDAMRELVKLTDILICGSQFGMGLTGLADVQEAGEALQQMGPQIVVQTEGDLGSYTSTDGESFHTPAFRIPVVDTTGAGDVYHGAYLFGLLQGWDVHRTAVFATAVAAIKCIRLGGRLGIPNYSEVIAFLQERGYDF